MDYRQQPEAALIEQARRGDNEALGELLERARDISMRTARNLLHDEELCRDLVQDAAVNMQRRFAQYRGDASFTTYYLRTVINRCISYKRRVRRHERLSYRLISREPDPEQRYALKERKAILHYELGRIKPTLRDAIVMYYGTDLVMREVGWASGVSKAAVKERIGRGLEHLHRRIQRHLTRAGRF